MSPLDVFFAIILLFCSVIYSGATADGWTDPSGPIIQLKGSEIRIRCGVNGNKYSGALWFYNNSVPVNAKFVNVINASLIEMVLPDASEQESVIVCKLGQNGISYNDIKIGRRPDKITNLKCISRNWYDMDCTFEKPYNPVAVQYHMQYRIPMSYQIYQCQQPAVKDPKTFTCHIPYNSYRRANPTFEFMLSATNVFDTTDQIITIANHESIIPAAPENFKEVKIMSDHVVMRWDVNSNILVFPGAFDYEFLIVSPTECDPEPKRLRFLNLSSVDPSTDSPKNFSQAIDLKFANTWYDISVRMKITAAPENEEMWSAWAKAQVKTAMRRPDNPPEVDIGSFNIGPGGDIYIYWKHLQKCYQNGANYNYTVTSSNKQYEWASENLSYLAIYKKDHVNLMMDTTFTISNFNSFGASKNASQIVIPGDVRRLDGPTKIRKVLVNGSYKLSWSPPANALENITSYTVFWCVSKSELPNSCENSFDFVRRSPTETSFDYTSAQTINFAVSANSKTSTSGMVWAKCTTASSKEIGKIKTIWIPRLASTEIEVEWKLECTDSGVVAGYQLEYCASKVPKTLQCMERAKSINITGGLDHPKHTLTGLTPYTTYKIIIRMFSNSTMGPPSDPLANTTLEAAPSEVRGLIARNIGNTSVELYWDPPEHSNGVLLFYKVWANGKDHKVNEQDRTVEIDSSAYITRMNYTLMDLIASTEYDIAVEACTKECSKPSTTKIKTTIGAPGNFSRQPSIDTYRENIMRNYSSAAIAWDEPMFKGGNLDYYEFKTKYTARDNQVYEHIVKTRKKDCYIEQLCVGDVMFYDFSVRAVNFVPTPHSKAANATFNGTEDRQSCDKDDAVLMKSLLVMKDADPHGWFLPGPWSPPIGHSCNYIGVDSKQAVTAMFLVMASLVIIVMMFYSYRKIKDMKDILVQMPPGLEDLTGDKLKKSKELAGNLEKMGKPDILHNVDNISINCEDENGQLLKRSLNGSHNGADSSSTHSDSTRSEVDHEDEIEYGAFDGDQDKHDALKILSGKVASPILISPELARASTPILEKSPKPNIILNPKAPMPSNGYVSQPPVRVISPASPVNANGYVTHSMFNPMQSSGYTPLSAFGKPTRNQISAVEDKINLKTPIVATTDQEGISGYVTHKQLSDFGHRMQ